MAEALATISAIIPIVSFVSSVLTRVFLREDSAWNPIIPSDDKDYFTVCYLNHPANQPWSPIECSPEDLDSLPDQPDGTVRMYIRCLPRREETDGIFHRHLEAIGCLDSDILFQTVPSSGFEAFASQWNGTKQRRFGTESFHLVPAMVKEFGQQKGIDHINADALLAGMVRIKVDMCNMNVSGNKSIVVLTCAPTAYNMWRFWSANLNPRRAKRETRTRSAQLWPEIKAWLHGFVEALHRDDESYQYITRASSSIPYSKQLLLFRCHSAILSRYSRFLDDLDNHYVRKRETMTNPEGSTLRSTVLEDMIMDANIYNELFHSVSSLSENTATFVDLLKTHFEGYLRAKSSEFLQPGHGLNALTPYPACRDSPAGLSTI